MGRRLRWVLLSALLAAAGTGTLIRLAGAAAPGVHGAALRPAHAAAVLTGAQILIAGPIDMTSQMPQIRLHLHVLDAQGGMVAGLGPSDFVVTEDGAPVDELTVAEEAVGLAVVAVIDRGGMTQPGVVGQRRWEDAVLLTISLTQQLPETDLRALVAIDAGGNLAPTTTLSSDVNAVAGALAEAGPIRNATALYDGLCGALDQLSTAALPELQETLAQRRKALVVFADGKDSTSTHCTATDVRDRARALQVAIYTIGMDTPEDRRTRNYTPVDPTQLQWLAEQTGGLYLLHVDAASHEAVRAFFGRLTTQGRQYLLSFTTRAPQGAHELAIQAGTPDGQVSTTATFTSTLQLPEVALIAPENGLVITRAGDLTVTMPLSLAIDLQFPDGLPRDPARVEYVVNGVVLAEPEAPPYEAQWDVARIPTGTYVVEARVVDAWIRDAEPVVSDQARLQIVPLPPVAPDQTQLALAWLQENLTLIICVPGALLLIAGVILLNRRLLAGMRRTSMRLAETMPAVFGPARGRLVVTKGNSVGKEFRLVKALTVVGREQALCDIALEDRYVSARHATLRIAADGTVAITDEGSQNGTLVNGLRIPPRQAIPVPFDATIRMGETELVLRAAARDKDQHVV